MPDGFKMRRVGEGCKDCNKSDVDGEEIFKITFVKTGVKDGKKPKMDRECDRRVSSARVTRRLDDISSEIMDDVKCDFCEKRKMYKNLVNEEAREYDNRLFEEIGCTSCLRDTNKFKKCLCAKCIMEDILAISMILDGADYITNIRGHKIHPVCRDMYDPIVEKRDGRYYLLTKSDVKNFNAFYPISEVLRDFNKLF